MIVSVFLFGFSSNHLLFAGLLCGGCTVALAVFIKILLDGAKDDVKYSPAMCYTSMLDELRSDCAVESNGVVFEVPMVEEAKQKCK